MVTRFIHGSNISLNDLLEFVVSLGLEADTSEAKVAGAADGFRKMGSAHLPVICLIIYCEATVTQVEETTILRSDITYDCRQSLNPAVDLGQASWLSACDNS
ncbi:hypothetical protein POTOM_017965 [Populus tomentosa]|uniref:Uncharacterized protein n=1 Tax=Populus tomentosa TaxID=118781 RepID=A0A8X8D535_POPTO|nr:hypothetical protein POTOM_017965 [Populus tomentosa]